MASQTSVAVHYDDLVAHHPPPVLVIKKQPRAAGAGGNTRVWKYPVAILAIAEVKEHDFCHQHLQIVQYFLL